MVAERGWPDDPTELPGVGAYTAAAIRNFAFDEDVLPVDTNVRRVQERTGHAFSARSAQALMDLGATVCLARIPRCGVCPLARAAPRAAAGTSRCAGSPASKARSASVARHALRAIVAGDPVDDAEAVAALARDGLVSLDDGIVALPT